MFITGHGFVNICELTVFVLRGKEKLYGTVL